MVTEPEAIRREYEQLVKARKKRVQDAIDFRQPVGRSGRLVWNYSSQTTLLATSSSVALPSPTWLPRQQVRIYSIAHACTLLIAIAPRNLQLINSELITSPSTSRLNTFTPPDATYSGAGDQEATFFRAFGAFETYQEFKTPFVLNPGNSYLLQSIALCNPVGLVNDIVTAIVTIEYEYGN